VTFEDRYRCHFAMNGNPVSIYLSQFFIFVGVLNDFLEFFAKLIDELVYCNPSNDKMLVDRKMRRASKENSDSNRSFTLREDQKRKISKQLKRFGIYFFIMKQCRVKKERFILETYKDPYSSRYIVKRPV